MMKMVNFIFLLIFYSCGSSATDAGKEIVEKNQLIRGGTLNIVSKEGNAIDTVDDVLDLGELILLEGKVVPKETIDRLFASVIYSDYYLKVVLDSFKQGSNYNMLYLTIECLSGDVCQEHRLITANDSAIIASQMIAGEFIGNTETDEFSFVISEDTILRKRVHFQTTEEGDTLLSKVKIERFVIESNGLIHEVK
jgi:hypothetical protein